MLRRRIPAVGSGECAGFRHAAKALSLMMGVLLATSLGFADEAVKVVPDNITYNVGDPVRVQVITPIQDSILSVAKISLSIRYAGESEPAHEFAMPVGAPPPIAGRRSIGYMEVWRIPPQARTGRYAIDLRADDRQSGRQLLQTPHAASFAVHRKLVRIRRIELDKTFYTSGDPVGCRVTLESLSDQPLTDLLVRFSDRHWPWIGPPPDSAAISSIPLATGLTLAPRAVKEIACETPFHSKYVERPTIYQFSVEVSDGVSRNIRDIGFSSPVWFQPPGVDSPKPYGLQYVYPELAKVDTSSYRHFEPPSQNSAAIRFDASHTSFPAGAEVGVKFSLRNPTDTRWRNVTVRASLRSLGSAGFDEKTVARRIDLEPRAAALEKEVTFALPADKGGVFRVVIQVRDRSGKTLAENNVEIASNSLPKSILILCAHEDDEGSLAGLIRAAVENHIPLEIVYSTGGDAGSCDRYYQRSCGPAEALYFGSLRMEETRASLAHLGVSSEHIHFLGLPDGGSGEIWYRHKDAVDPYLSVLLASDHAPYEGLVHPNLPYARQPVIEVVKELMRKFRPQAVFAAHPPSQGHIDHIVNGYLVIKALQELAREDAAWGNTKVFTGRVYDPASAPKTPYRYKEYVVHVPGEVAARAQEAWWFYQSQGGNRALGRLRRLDELRRTETHRQVLNWMEHEGWNEKD